MPLGSPAGDDHAFVADDGEACYSGETQNFYMRKRRPEDEIEISRLGEDAKKLFLGQGGSRERKKSRPFKLQIAMVLVPFASTAARRLKNFGGDTLIGLSLRDGMRNGRTWATSSTMAWQILKFQNILEQRADGSSKAFMILTSISSTALCPHLPPKTFL